MSNRHPRACHTRTLAPPFVLTVALGSWACGSEVISGGSGGGGSGGEGGTATSSASGGSSATDTGTGTSTETGSSTDTTMMTGTYTEPDPPTGTGMDTTTYTLTDTITSTDTGPPNDPECPATVPEDGSSCGTVTSLCIYHDVECGHFPALDDGVKAECYNDTWYLSAPYQTYTQTGVNPPGPCPCHVPTSGETCPSGPFGGSESPCQYSECEIFDCINGLAFQPSTSTNTLSNCQ